MRKRKEEQKGFRINLLVLLTGIVFIIILGTSILLNIIVYILIKHDIINDLHPPGLPQIMLLFGIFSVLIATALTFILGRIPLRPIRELINATKQLAAGNFDVRIHLNGPAELREFSRSFNIMAEELGNTKILRSDFINNFSHEFKTPIVSLRGFAKILKNDQLTKEERDEYLDIIISESDRLSVLAINILFLTKLENQTLLTERGDFHLAEQIRRVILMLEPKWSSKLIDMTIDLEEISYFGNEEMLSQVWINLIDNAIKFTPQGGTVEVKASSSATEIVVQVSDTGYGMEKEVKQHIYDKFYQGDTSRATKGNGLGLAIVKNIIGLHDGSIQVESEPNMGTTFVVTLPKGQ